MGFCIFNNIAIAARDALSNGLQRVMVIDYDAHHGNGTQTACLEDERFGFISTHQWGIYPGTGWITDAPHARRRLVNVPLEAYAGDKTFEHVTDQIFKPVVESFRPQMLFISAGFDAHWNDPLTSLGLSTHGFYNISKKLVDLAEEYCNGRIVFVLEGGYDPRNVVNGAMAVFDSLTSSPLPPEGRARKDAHDPSPYAEGDHQSRISEVRNWHGIT
jgi:acetoin utilization deacetylase AcuC-like enzyme